MPDRLRFYDWDGMGCREFLGASSGFCGAETVPESEHCRKHREERAALERTRVDASRKTR